LLNSSPCRFTVRSFFVETQIAPQVLQRLNIPQFDPQNTIHLRLAKLSEKAHGAAQKEGKERLRAIEDEIDELVAQIWGLSEDELREIKQSLEELG